MMAVAAGCRTSRCRTAASQGGLPRAAGRQRLSCRFRAPRPGVFPARLAASNPLSSWLPAHNGKKLSVRMGVGQGPPPLAPPPQGRRKLMTIRNERACSTAAAHHGQRTRKPLVAPRAANVSASTWSNDLTCRCKLKDDGFLHALTCCVCTCDPSWRGSPFKCPLPFSCAAAQIQAFLVPGCPPRRQRQWHSSSYSRHTSRERQVPAQGRLKR